MLIAPQAQKKGAKIKITHARLKPVKYRLEITIIKNSRNTKTIEQKSRKYRPAISRKIRLNHNSRSSSYSRKNIAEITIIQSKRWQETKFRQATIV